MRPWSDSQRALAHTEVILVSIRALAAGLAGGVLLLGCGGKARELGKPGVESICAFPGANDAGLPLEVARFGSEAMGAGSRAVYLAESMGEGRLVRAPRRGGAFTLLGANLFYVEIRTDGADVYVIAQGFAGAGSALYRVSAAEELELLDAELKGASDLVVTPTRLYLSDGLTGSVYRYDRSGRGRTVVAADVGTAHLAADGETLYYLAASDARTGLYRLEADLSSTLVWGGPLRSPARLFFHDGLLYAAGAGIHAFDLEAQQESAVCDTPNGINDVVHIDDTFYFTTGIFQGDLARVPVTGGLPEILASKLGYGGIASDGVSVFYDSGSSALAFCPPAAEAP
jgi:hypothetical protein